jgi:hypothetical protein
VNLEAGSNKEGAGLLRHRRQAELAVLGLACNCLGIKTIRIFDRRDTTSSFTTLPSFIETLQPLKHLKVSLGYHRSSLTAMTFAWKAAGITYV